MVDGATTNAVTIGELSFRMVLWNIDDEVELVVGNHVEHFVFSLFVRPRHGCRLDIVLVKETGCTLSGKDVVAGIDKSFYRLKKVNLDLQTARRLKDVLLGDVVTCGYHRVEKSLVEVVAETSHLSR